MNIIADIAGQYDALLRLVEKMPDEDFVLVGDLNDRGPKTMQVIQWAMDNESYNVTTIKGNHEHMMVDAYYHKNGNFYEPNLWPECNGGYKTVISYLDEVAYKEINIVSILSGEADWRKYMPEGHIEWLASRPLYLEDDGLLISHACKHHSLTVEQACELGPGFYNGRYKPENKGFGVSSDTSFLWNRSHPKRIDGVMQIFGHMANKDSPRYYNEKYPNGICGTKVDDCFAIGIDCSFGQVLTGINWPSLDVYQVPYIEDANRVKEVEL